MKSLNLPFLAVMVMLIVTGCSGGGNPITPDGISDPGESPEPLESLLPLVSDSHREPQQLGASARVPLALYTITADPDAGKLYLEVTRSAAMHLNGVIYLEGGPEKYLGLAGPPQFSQGGLVLDVDVRITHPNPDPVFTVFDVHGILLTKGSISTWAEYGVIIGGSDKTRLLNPDGYTRWWNPREFKNHGLFGYLEGDMGTPLSVFQAATINGYKTFADGLGAISSMSDLDPALRGMFSANSQCTRHYKISLANGLIFNYAIDASWAMPTNTPPTPPGDFPLKANMPEPYWIDIDEWNNTLWYESANEKGGNAFYNITIHDWQSAESIGPVRVEIPALEINEDLTNLLDEGPNHKKYGFNIETPELESTGNLVMLVTVDSLTGTYQTALTNVDKPLRAYNMYTTSIASESPTDNMPPVANAEATTVTGIPIGESVSFDGSESYDPDGTIVSYEWDFNGDGTYGDPYDSGTDIIPTKFYPEPGNFDVRLRVTDDEDAIAESGPIPVNVTENGNLMPYAIAVAVTPTTIMSDQTVEFDASASYDTDGTVDQYLWDFDGDGTYGDSYDSGDDIHPVTSWGPGEYNVDLRVVDNSSGSDLLDQKIHISVGNYPPTASAIATTATNILSGESVTFDASASSDVDGTIEQFLWDFDGDSEYGDSFDSGPDNNPTVTFHDTGNFAVNLRVVDDYGDDDYLDSTILVNVTNLPPTADAIAVTSTDIFKSETVEFDASGSFDPNGTIDQYLWDFDGDANYGDTFDSGTDSNPVKAFPDAGSFNVDLRVVDNNGADDFLDAPIVVNVTNAPPTAVGEIVDSEPYYMYYNYTLSGSPSTDDGEIVNYEWDLNWDGSFDPTVFGEYAVASWDVNDDYDIMLRVTDDDGASDMLDTPLQISIQFNDNHPPSIDELTMSRTTVLKNSTTEVINLNVVATDSDIGDTLTYEWYSNSGYFSDPTIPNPVWYPPDLVTKLYLECVVTDNHGAWTKGTSGKVRVTHLAVKEPSPAPDYESERLVGTGTFNLSDYTPGRVIMMNFWATW